MTEPMPSTEERLVSLERAMSGLIQERDALVARLHLLEEALRTGLADLTRTTEELKARRPPLRRRMDELEEKLTEILPPALETTEPGTSPPARDGGTP